MADWKDTLNLPRTGFPMKANLQTAEPRGDSPAGRRWTSTARSGSAAGAAKFVLHDGPPYANGRRSTSARLNKILKDFVVKSRTMAGFDAPYVPGWDCHGLPIELKVDKELGPKKREMSVGRVPPGLPRLRRRFVDIQREDFKRLGVFGDWDHPYLTMNYGYQAAIVRALGGSSSRGWSTRARSPCTGASTAARRWPRPRSSTRTTPRRRSTSSSRSTRPSAGELAARVPGARRPPVSVLIWTTTPWTIPSNLAIAFHPGSTTGLPVGARRRDRGGGRSRRRRRAAAGAARRARSRA
jgi:isoleucyl-tRNA synthetase